MEAEKGDSVRFHNQYISCINRFVPDAASDCNLSIAMEARISGKYGRVLLTHGPWRGLTSEWPSVLAGLGCPDPDHGKTIDMTAGWVSPLPGATWLGVTSLVH